MIRSLAALAGAVLPIGLSAAQVLPERPDLSLDEQSAWVVTTTRVSEQLGLQPSEKKAISAAFVSFDQSEKQIIEHGAETGEQLSALNHHLAGQVLSALSATQRKRLHQIALQLKGPYALEGEAVANELKLSSEQRAKIHEIVEEADARDEEYSSGAADYYSSHPHSTSAERSKITIDLQPRRNKLSKLKRGDAEKILKVLTQEQRDKWTSMLGERMP